MLSTNRASLVYCAEFAEHTITGTAAVATTLQALRSASEELSVQVAGCIALHNFATSQGAVLLQLPHACTAHLLRATTLNRACTALPPQTPTVRRSCRVARFRLYWRLWNSTRSPWSSQKQRCLLFGTSRAMV